ncbi:hypothetical protein [Lactiplantibacillus pentosus]|uniref:hypothetical protein n=1 Tax=Lactiplantibacillus pentosus TaxID=1589 RepID=UPI002181FD3C|nr:hypothetical protein [Lactiplantibacillus pentosus]MCT0162305.1 hypothetical protein [Lactiplantibacillus pentosus]
MWRHRFLIKGSEQELTWLNSLAARHHLLTGIHGNWYQFKKVEPTYRVFSEYVAQDVSTTVTDRNSAFQVLTTVPVKGANVDVIYTGSDQPSLQQTKLAPSDPQMRLKVALQLRDQAMNTINLSLYAGVIVWGLFLVFLIQRQQLDLLGPWLLLLLVGLLAILGLYRISGRLQSQISQLRRETEQYDGAWMPTMHVFVSPLAAELDVEVPELKSLGRWTLVGHDKRGKYWYDVQTLASTAEIKQVIQSVTADQVHIDIFSWLRLAPVGWFV